MNASRRKPRWLKSVLGAALLGLLTRAGAAEYTVTDLGNAHRINGSPGRVLNDRGEVLGNDIADNGQPWLYTGGAWTALGRLNTSGSGTTTTVGTSLNNSGRVVGYGDTGRTGDVFDQTDGFFIDGAGGTLTPLNLVSAANNNQSVTTCTGNDRGMIAGTIADYTAGTRETFLFVPGTGLTNRASSASGTIAINTFGDVLGVTGGETPQATLNGVALPAVTAGLTPRAINDAGQILLTSRRTGEGTLYDYGTGKARLIAVPAGVPAFLALNDLGEVVGRITGADDQTHAIFCTPAGGLISLDELGLTDGVQPVHLTEAHGINNKGQIVCLGYTTDANDIHGYLLTPNVASALPLAAAYDGLASVGGANLGAISIAVGKAKASTNTNVASVKLLAPGVSHSFKVTLTGGAFSGTVEVKGVTLNVTLQADAANQRITGTIVDGATTYDVVARRQAKLALFAAKYTALLHLVAPNPALPQGIGYGQMTVSKSGAIKITGLLGDGSTYSVSAKPHTDGTWTFYSPLYTRTAQPGGIAGLMTFDRTAADSDCAGTLRWNKPGGFVTDVLCRAARYITGKNQQVLRLTNTVAGVATFAFAGGEQTLTPRTVSVSGKNAVTVTAPDPDPAELTVKITAGSGAMSGSFLHDVSGVKTKFTGAVQQKLNIAAGVFQGTTTSGSVLLTPQ